MDTVAQDAFATLELSEEGGTSLTGLARALLEAGVNEMMAAQVPSRFLRTFRQFPRPALRYGSPSSSVTSR